MTKNKIFFFRHNLPSSPVSWDPYC